MSGSKITTKDDAELGPVHPGEMLRQEFLIGSKISAAQVAEATGLNIAKLKDLLAEKIAVDADIDLRLSRYFGMAEGFFLRLQNHFDLATFRRDHGTELDGIPAYAE